MISHFLLAVSMERQAVSAKPEHLMLSQQVVVKQVEQPAKIQQPAPIQTYVIARPVYPVLRKGMFSRQMTTLTPCSTGNCR